MLNGCAGVDAAGCCRPPRRILIRSSRRQLGYADGMSSKREATVRVLLDRYGRTFAQEAGIRLADRPGPLYQLLVMATLLSARISADIAIAAARELFAAGYKTPAAMRKASWQDRVDALGRGHYRRYDERTATMLGDAAELLTQKLGGDLRKIRGDAGHVKSALTEFPGIGPAGADIFLREVQAVWPEVSPYVDRRVLEGARRVGLPVRAGALAGLATPGAQLASLAAALVRVSRSERLADEVAKEVKAA
jgi:endonuclease III